MPAPQSRINSAWATLFAARPILHDIDTTGQHRITAREINTIGGHEARLMTKFDHTVNLPQLFAQHGLAIIPDSRSSYVIGRFECYAGIDQTEIDEEPIGRQFPDLQTLPPYNHSSEPAALLCAHHAGLINDVLEEEVSLTVFGRMSTGEFDFSIQSTTPGGIAIPQPVHVDRAQCEIDGGFEGPESFAIIEVKNEEVEDFHVRQLYYPFRLWQRRINKRVVPVFLTYSNEIFTFSVYDFPQPDDYNSLQLIRRKRYQIEPTEIELADVRAILGQTQAQPEPDGIPFPQADSFTRVIDMLTRLFGANGLITREETTTNYAFNVRQTNYYTDAGRYLGLIDKGRTTEAGVFYTLTATGLQLMNQAPRLRNLALIRLIVSRSVFRAALEYYLANAQAPTRDEIAGFMQSAGIPINHTTAGRRASSVLGWIRWIINLTADA